MKPPRLYKAHRKAIADALVARGWTLVHEFRTPEDPEPYEILLEWTKTEGPPKVDTAELLKENQK
jgi:hypothetical protein